MGLVYRARQRRPARVVALKVISPEAAADPEFRRRFEREAAIAAEIEHPNVIPVYQVGEDGGLLYIAMRFVEGVDLAGLLAARGRLEPGRVGRLIAQVADALDAAHARGLVHRDVKPGNVLVTASDHAYLTDFGITKRTADSVGLTKTGALVGTADYIAPEQIEGRSLDARADVYALGGVTYQLLSGRVPFPRESAVAKIFAHLKDPPPRLEDVPAPLADAVQRAMAKRPDDRFESAGDFGRAVIAGTAEPGESGTVPSRGSTRTEPAPTGREPSAAFTQVAAAPMGRLGEQLRARSIAAVGRDRRRGSAGRGAEATRRGVIDTGGDGDELADGLAEEVFTQWARSAADRRLEVPSPIQVQWTRSALPVAGPIRSAVGSTCDPPRFTPLPGLERVTAEDLGSGQLRDLHNVYGGLQSGRLLIAGAPGSGKSGAAVLLVLDALRHRARVSEIERRRVPVPVLLTFRAWDPASQRIEAWLVAQLTQTYPLFGGQRGVASAEALLRAGKLAVVLDGFDEIPRRLRGSAMRALSEQATFRVVVLARGAEIVAAAEEAHLVDAVALELQPVDAWAAADYLARVQREPAPPGWREVIEHLRRRGESPIATALSSPLALTLVRDTYRDNDNLSELITIARENDVENRARQEIENHLLDRALPVAYAPRPGEPAPPIDLQSATRTLSYIARRMHQEGTQDLTWWQIRNWVRRAPRMTATVIACGLVGGAAGGVVGAIGGGLSTWLAGIGPLGAWLILSPLVGLLAGFSVSVVIGRTERSPQPDRFSIRRLLLSRGGLGRAIAATVILGTGTLGALEAVGTLGTFLFFGSLILGALGLLSVFIGRERSVDRHLDPLDPLGLWQADGAHWRALGVAFGLLLWVVSGLIIAIPFVLTTSRAGTFVVTFFAILFPLGLASGLAVWLAGSARWSSSLAFLQLARLSKTPARLMRFLEDARQRGVLRTVGPVYQFRHARLQERLIGATDTTSPTHDVNDSKQSAG